MELSSRQTTREILNEAPRFDNSAAFSMRVRIQARASCFQIDANDARRVQAGERGWAHATIHPKFARILKQPSITDTYNWPPKESEPSMIGRAYGLSKCSGSPKSHEERVIG
jgi:hypothetical protein